MVKPKIAPLPINAPVKSGQKALGFDNVVPAVKRVSRWDQSSTDELFKPDKVIKSSNALKVFELVSLSGVSTTINEALQT